MFNLSNNQFSGVLKLFSFYFSTVDADLTTIKGRQMSLINQIWHAREPFFVTFGSQLQLTSIPNHCTLTGGELIQKRKAKRPRNTYNYSTGESMRKLKHMVYGNVKDKWQQQQHSGDWFIGMLSWVGKYVLLVLGVWWIERWSHLYVATRLVGVGLGGCRGRGISTETENRGNIFDNAVEHHSLHSLPLWRNQTSTLRFEACLRHGSNQPLAWFWLQRLLRPCVGNMTHLLTRVRLHQHLCLWLINGCSRGTTLLRI